MRLGFTTDCVSLPRSAVPALHAMIDEARQITGRVFQARTLWRPVAQGLGYALGAELGLHLLDDYHVGFYVSRWRGRRCYYMRHSSIEYVFAEEEIER